MRDARAWIALLAVVSFLAGAAAGILLDPLRHATRPERGPFGDYYEALVRHFELDPARTQALRVLLHHYEADVQRIRDRHSAELLAAMEPELRETGREYTERLRNQLLPPADRAEFDRLAAECAVDL